MTMHDSGKRQAFATGAERDTADDKPRPDLFSPFALERVGDWLALGAKKYSERNWEKGMPFSRVTASLVRHVVRWQQGDWSEDHLAAICFNAQALMHYQAMIQRGVLPRALDDMPIYSAPQPTDPVDVDAADPVDTIESATAALDRQMRDLMEQAARGPCQ